MLRSGILNPQLLALLARFRHTNTLVIADRGFPFWPQIETVDISLVDGIPTVMEVLSAVSAMCAVGHAWMAEEFRRENGDGAADLYRKALGKAELRFEAHGDFKRKVPSAVGLIRTGDVLPFANIILESA